MRKLPALLLVFVLSASCLLPTYAHARTRSQAQARAARKMQKKQQKAMRKYIKAQQKAQRRMIKRDRKNTHLPKHY